MCKASELSAGLVKMQIPADTENLYKNNKATDSESELHFLIDKHI
jgi:hypothetical protein